MEFRREKGTGVWRLPDAGDIEVPAAPKGADLERIIARHKANPLVPHHKNDPRGNGKSKGGNLDGLHEIIGE